MAFTGVPVKTLISDRACSITGVSLAAANTSGTIGFAGSGADIELPAAFVASSYSYQGSTIGLDAAMQVNINPVSAAGLTNLQPSVASSGTVTGTNPASFRITITNTSAALSTQTLSILVENKGSGGHVGEPTRIA